MNLCEEHANRLFEQTEDLDGEQRQFAEDLIFVNFVEAAVSPSRSPRECLDLIVPNEGPCAVCWISENCTCEETDCADPWIDQASHLAHALDAVEVEVVEG